MKLILTQYLAGLREREELDAILPDLLSQMGLNVFSRPGRGTRQDGVDVAAVGSIEKEPETVYLFSVKPGDLTRSDWHSVSVQSLRPSLEDILDAYIPSRLPAQHRDKPIVIVICIGGVVREEVRPAIKGYLEEKSGPKVSFVEWNGDRLADLIQKFFLSDGLITDDTRSSFRKSLSMLDEPETAYKHYVDVLNAITAEIGSQPAKDVRAIRQMSVCLWVLYSWARDIGNLEAAFRCSELTLLYAWTVMARYVEKKGKNAAAVKSSFMTILHTYLQSTGDFVVKCILGPAQIQDGISSAIRTSNGLDVNLKVFDLLGRIASLGCWYYWNILHFAENEDQHDQLVGAQAGLSECAGTIKRMIKHNPVLFLPIKDEQVIDVSLAVLVLSIDSNNEEDMEFWVSEMLRRARFSYTIHGNYPAIIDGYNDLLDHPKTGDEEYRGRVTSASVLYPMIALWAGIYGWDRLYEDVGSFQTEDLSHSNFQFWYPNEESESHLYLNTDRHGTTLSGLDTRLSKEEFVSQSFEEIESVSSENRLTAFKYGFWPIVLVACRHHRLPIPVEFYRDVAMSQVGIDMPSQTPVRK